ncbi:hypothetical protein TBLA_0I02940 [Henningerozyma blattae CBS 6284]|uniref:Peptidase M16 N-terminal domain-containing protein n=1 Tax=Henningerozyma blattae (strain ATCC 34711 / CBS 6284 / DSM 70876 / NBRC 10599 / NRRL Y-10934 / UCD 77-7) TaxID=1071380 RepID=I2H998_HENB6|nr:hypothetical protein TBLA_0I02940 [Tetrapisispora blattae CBS 6284]CCH62950.1 hypothetical protein TBLA_0I02940 [Tetrapisispora blattae CBS 6284]
MSTPYKTYNLNFAKPDLDDRNYRFIELPNSLKVLLIQDATTDKAAASLDVNIGAFEDPEGLPGLAHFCEHLLFMGSEKYPDENEYSSFLSTNGGSYNAYTGALNTNYFFEINYEHLEGALDRFSGFFSRPLFSKDSTDKEINAVDSENKKNLQSDVWRMYQLDKSLSNRKHPYHKFSTGNIQTLGTIPNEQGLDIRDELLKFYNNSYSANLMKLTILGREDLDILGDWAYSMFKDVKNLNRELPVYEEKMLTEEYLMQIINIKPVQDMRKLELSFTVPDLDKEWESKTPRILSHLLGHEGSGSLLAHLKCLGWATELAAGGHTISDDNAVFSVDIDLTEEGFNHYEDVTVAIFQYINMLKDTLPQEWIYDELQAIANAEFKFKQKTSPSGTVSSLSKALEKEYIPVEKILATSLFSKYEPELLMNYINELTPYNSRLSLISKDVETDEVEEWYGTEYKSITYPKKFIKRLERAGFNKNLYLPNPNDFVATNFDVKKIDNITPIDEPYLLKDDQVSKLWFKKDDRFWQPRGYIHIFTKLPHSHASITNSMLTSLYVQLVNDQLKDLQYDASCASLDISFSKTGQGLDITVSGFNHKILILLESFLKGIKNFKLEKSRFLIFQEKYIQQLKNMLFQVPYGQVSHYYNYVIDDRAWSIKEKLSTMQKLTFEDLENFLPTIFNEVYFESLVHGNFEKSDAAEVNQLVEKYISGSIHNPQIRNDRLRSYVLQKGETYRYETLLEDPENVNSCIQHVTQIGLYNDRLAALSSLFAQIINEPCFNILRTKEQLGYVVFSSSLNNYGTTNIRILVQSEHTTEYLEWRIDEFYKSVKTILTQMAPETFENHKDALCKTLLQKYKNMKEESSRYSNSIFNGDYDYLLRQNKAKLVSKFSKSDILQFYDEYIVNENSSKLIIHLKSQISETKKDEPKLDRTKYPTGELIDDVAEFKSNQFIAPAHKPVKKFQVQEN